ncbi:MAG: hypothetical protein WKF78_13565 [Candidatus Limnocylindrales bacterium]
MSKSTALRGGFGMGDGSGVGVGPGVAPGASVAGTAVVVGVAVSAVALGRGVIRTVAWIGRAGGGPAMNRSTLATSDSNRPLPRPRPG